MSPVRMHPAHVVLLLFIVVATACVPLPPPTETPETPADTAAAKQPTEGQPAMTIITGNVTYLQRIALQPDAVVEVQLQDISRADAPAVVLGEQRIETNGQQVPIPYVIEYDLSQIDPANLYSIRATITEGGKLTWTSTRITPVITRGAPTDQVEILVQPVGN